MLSIEEYNAAEATAKELMPQLYADNRWGVQPDEQPHLVWAHKFSDLQVLLNRFQCDRYRSYMYELGGMSRKDVEYFMWIRKKLIDMQTRYYPEIAPTVPVETMLSAMAIHRRIKAARPTATSILEIGPGSGLNSLFFCSDFLLKNYTQIEATQATYLSQMMVNETYFGESPMDVWEAADPSMTDPTPTARVWHLPWWRTNEVYDRSMMYDVITANACLNEISDAMVNYYLQMFKSQSHDHTLLLLQDIGAYMYRDDNRLIDMLKDAGWHIVAATDNWTTEGIIGNAGHGDAVSTWWLTKHEGEIIRHFTRRCDEGSANLHISSGNFSFPGYDRFWTRTGLALGEPE